MSADIISVVLIGYVLPMVLTWVFILCRIFVNKSKFHLADIEIIFWSMLISIFPIANFGCFYGWTMFTYDWYREQHPVTRPKMSERVADWLNEKLDKKS